ncbi:aminotransferase-like domain-containing protein [Chengkuizengella axinellae]|uniref:PLP-dependent aminotransferase family protein n=1 Tax=Chengkuizengella axinellae TaxID=3064388 RepID=A0ABT9IVX7_9BACL|nr:PLP-dependent aminotransferase family protein [Chengkuizengella sp. 2205SS18-9]MDP5272940.1 PLP-dependent aminotransferase family protein [Chengkuizengella sp. 2205SS18-9]
MKKFENMMNEIESRITTGELSSGEKLPSIRELAIQFGCSKSTVVHAYQELEKKHVIYSIPQSGYFVVERKVNKSTYLHKENIDFSSAAPDPVVFPYLDFQHCINKAIDIYKEDLFTYTLTRGLSPLIRVLENHLANYQVFTKQENIFITSGVQQALAILATMPFPNQKTTILIEEPSYHNFIKLLKLQGIPIMGIKRDAEGIDLNELEQIFKTQSIKFFYTIPRYHNPLGTSYTEQQKKTIADLAKKYDVYIVEDDYLADIESNQKSDPIFAYSPVSHVVYLKSYAKMIFPGLRVGAAVIPETLKENFYLFKKLTDIDTSMISQAALEIYIKNGMFERHKEKMKSTYTNRLLYLNEMLKQYGDKDLITYPELTSGVYTHIKVHQSINIKKVIQNLEKQKVILVPVDENYISLLNREKILHISITRTNKEQIKEGVIKLLKELKRAKSSLVY